MLGKFVHIGAVLDDQRDLLLVRCADANQPDLRRRKDVHDVQLQLFDAALHRRREEHRRIVIIKKRTLDRRKADDVRIRIFVEQLSLLGRIYRLGGAEHIDVMTQRLELALERLDNKNDAVNRRPIGIGE